MHTDAERCWKSFSAPEPYPASSPLQLRQTLGPRCFSWTEGPRGRGSPRVSWLHLQRVQLRGKGEEGAKSHSERDTGQILATRTAWAESASVWTAPGSDR